MIEYVKSMRKLIGHEPLLMCGASMIVYNSTKQVLMLKRTDNGCWCFPGGAMELGESTEETARRELWEETGLKIDKIHLFGVFSGQELHYVYPNGDEVFNVDVVYTGSIMNDEIHMDAESREYQFFNIDQIPSEISPPVLPVVAELKRRHSHPD